MSSKKPQRVYSFPPDLEAALGDPDIPLPDRMKYRADIEEQVEKYRARGQADRIEPFFEWMCEDLQNEAVRCRRRNRAAVALEVAQRVGIPAATSLGVLLKIHGLG